MQEETKKVYSADDVQKMLGIGKSKTYEFLDQVFKNNAPFKVIKIGKQYRIFKKSFDEWIEKNQ